jgi:hypothetical protein
MRLTPRRFGKSLGVLALVLFASFAVQAQDTMDAWKDFDFRNNSIKQAQVQTLELYDLKLLRGLVFGRHGRVFKDAEIKSFLETQSWYKPNTEFKNSMLSETERRNLDVIRIAEAAKHPTIQPGDMRYWRDRAIPARKLGKHSGAEWKVLQAEVEAIHGKRFADEPWLQQYFEERYWYFPSDQYDAKKLSGIERKNLEVLSGAQKRQRRVALLPGDMEFFENKTISEQMLQGLSLHELRLLRNEIYARHGKVFKEPWLQKYFSSFAWYKADPEFTDAKLTEVEKQNIALIAAYEKRAVTAMSTIEG